MKTSAVKWYEGPLLQFDSQFAGFIPILVETAQFTSSCVQLNQAKARVPGHHTRDLALVLVLLEGFPRGAQNAW